MNNGYSYDNKILKENVTDQECADINSLNRPGLTCEYTTTRKILFDSIKQLIGTTGKITKENKEYYLSLGYSLNDTVGLSYLEKAYDKYLKGATKGAVDNKDIQGLFGEISNYGHLYYNLGIPKLYILQK